VRKVRYALACFLRLNEVHGHTVWQMLSPAPGAYIIGVRSCKVRCEEVSCVILQHCNTWLEISLGASALKHSACVRACAYPCTLCYPQPASSVCMHSSSSVFGNAYVASRHLAGACV
jgi:hypothetical protein